MTKVDSNRFAELRVKVARMIRDELAIDCCCKSYEGTWEVSAEYPNYFEDETASQQPKWYCITLHCYVLGPSRHYSWTGHTFSEALEKAEQAISEWER